MSVIFFVLDLKVVSIYTTFQFLHDMSLSRLINTDI